MMIIAIIITVTIVIIIFNFTAAFSQITFLWFFLFLSLYSFTLFLLKYFNNEVTIFSLFFFYSFWISLYEISVCEKLEGDYSEGWSERYQLEWICKNVIAARIFSAFNVYTHLLPAVLVQSLVPVLGWLLCGIPYTLGSGARVYCFLSERFQSLLSCKSVTEGCHEFLPTVSDMHWRIVNLLVYDQYLRVVIQNMAEGL